MAYFRDTLIQISGLSADGSWHTVDLSGGSYSVPSGSSGVMLVVRNQSTTINYAFGFRKPGSTDTRNGLLKAKSQTMAYVGIDSGRNLSYYLENSDLVVYLAGYFGQEAVFFDDGIPQTSFYQQTWTIMDLASNLPSNAKAVIVEAIDSNQTGSNFGLYAGAGTLQELKSPIKYHLWGIVGLDARRYMLYADLNAHLVHVVGYIISGQWFMYPWADKTLASADSFVDVDLTSNITEINIKGALIRVGWYSVQSEKRFILRKNGTGDDWNTSCELHDQCWYAVGIDTGDIFEGKIDDVNLFQEFFLVGLLDDPLLGVGNISATGDATISAGIMQSDTQVQATLTGDGSTYVDTSITIDLPMPQVEIELGPHTVIDLELPIPQIEMEIMTGMTMRIQIDFPMPEVEWITASQIEIDSPMPEVEISILTGSIFSIELDLPSPTVEIEATSGGQAQLEITLDLPMPQVEITTLQGVGASIEVELPALEVLLSLRSGQMIDIEIVSPSPTVELTSFTEAEMTIEIDLPAPLVQLALNQIPVTLIYRGIAMNLNHYAVTDYSGWRFNSFARYKGEVYGANENGLYKLGGEYDSGELIAARLRFGTLDMFKPIMRKARDAWLTYRSNGELALVIVLDEEDEYEDRLTLVDNKIHEERVKEPRGIKNRYHAYEIRNLHGADFSIESLRVLVEEVRRRAR